jgi:hypothetical protein
LCLCVRIFICCIHVHGSDDWGKVKLSP